MTPSSLAWSRTSIALFSAALLVVGAFVGGVVRDAWPDGKVQAAGGRVRDYALEIKPAEIQLAEGVVWHAWTFNGTIPGPTLKARVGDTLRVTVTNSHTTTHSFHTHLGPYEMEQDGSQLNTISGLGTAAMIAPGSSYTYVFRITHAGVNYYHCHSAGGDKMIMQHIQQGLYGAIVVDEAEAPEMRDEAIFMAERGFDVTGSGGPFYLMNGKGVPGGEHALEKVFAEKGIDGITALLGTTVPVIKAKVDEPVRITVVNIGDFIHSFHLHGVNMVSVDQYPGRVHPANVVQLVPGGADRVVIAPAEPGLWLFHCHVVSHADAGMIGVLVVEAA